VGSGIFQIILIIYIQFRVFRHVGDANILVPYILYTANMGLMLSILILTYELETLGIAFGLTAGVFGIMALYARYTKRNLSGVGLVGIGLFFGSIILMLINIFMRSTQIMWIVSFVSFGAVMLITMYDVWRITKISESGVESRNLALYFALNLFVDFIYLYMRILQFVAIARSR
jgi:FtsH-binding integral membrane protein